MNTASILVASVIAAAVIIAIIFIIRNRDKGGCQGDCRYCNKCK